MYPAAMPAKTRQQIETELLDRLQKAQARWKAAPESKRAAAKTKFIETLYAFNSVVIDRRLPGEGR